MNSKEYKLTIPSNPTSINEIAPFINRCKCDCNFSDNLYHDMLLVLTEAVNNSILHGNRSNPNKNVEIDLRVGNNNYSFKVKDEGEGFDLNKVPDPTHQSRITQPGGRGVHIMRTFANELNYSDNGRCVEIEFRGA